MRPTETTGGDAALTRVLQEWQVKMPLPPRFQEGVWQKIARADAPEGVGWQQWLTRVLESVLPRPKFAVSYLAVLLVAGVAGGSMAAHLKTRRLQSELGLRYVQSIDPYMGHNVNP